MGNGRKIEASALMHKANNDILTERLRQNELYGHQRHNHEVWLTIALEEVGEVAQAIQKARGWGKATDASNLYEEIVHTAAVFQALGEQVLEEMAERGLSNE